MEIEVAKGVVRDGLLRLLESQHDLFTSGVNERTVTSWLFVEKQERRVEVCGAPVTQP